MKTDDRFVVLMEMLLNELENASESVDVPVAAIVLDQDLNILSKGSNRRVELNDPVAHAEIEAIKNAGQKMQNWRLDNCTLISTLEPCQMCAGAIVQSRIKRVVFGATEPKSGSISTLNNSFRELNPNIEIIGGVLEKQSGEILRKWFATRRSDGDKI
jgi:tRNA(adenine34) deaminase